MLRANPRRLMSSARSRERIMYLEVKEAVWPRPAAGDVGPFWSFLYALHTYTSAPESPPWMKLKTAAEEFKDRKVAPILCIVGDGNVYCTTAEGSIVRFQHDTGKFRPFKGDFWKLLEQEVRELYERKERKKKGSA